MKIDFRLGIELEIEVDLAAKLASIRPAVEALIIRCVQEPNEMIHRSPSIAQLSHLIELLSDQQGQHVQCEKLFQPSDANDHRIRFYLPPTRPIESIFSSRYSKQPTFTEQPNSFWPTARGASSRASFHPPNFSHSSTPTTFLSAPAKVFSLERREKCSPISCSEDPPYQRESGRAFPAWQANIYLQANLFPSRLNRFPKRVFPSYY